MLQVTANLKEAGCGEATNPRANLRSDEQKSHIRLCMRVSLQHTMKPDSYTESCMVNAADRWRERNVCVFAPLRSVQNKHPLDALHPGEVCTICPERDNHYREIMLNVQKSAEVIVTEKRRTESIGVLSTTWKGGMRK